MGRQEPRAKSGLTEVKAFAITGMSSVFPTAIITCINDKRCYHSLRPLEEGSRSHCHKLVHVRLWATGLWDTTLRECLDHEHYWSAEAKMPRYCFADRYIIS